MRGQHIHTGIVTMGVVTIYAVIGINLWRIAASRLALSSNPTLQAAGAVFGGLVK